jgi:hypothetical protein
VNKGKPFSRMRNILGRRYQNAVSLLPALGLFVTLLNGWKGLACAVVKIVHNLMIQIKEIKVGVLFTSSLRNKSKYHC